MRLTIDDGLAKLAWLAWIPFFSIYLMENVANWNRKFLHVVVSLSLITAFLLFVIPQQVEPYLGLIIWILPCIWFPILIWMLVEVHHASDGINWLSMIPFIMLIVGIYSIFMDTFLVIIFVIWFGILWYIIRELVKHRTAAIKRISIPFIIWLLLFIPLRDAFIDLIHPRHPGGEIRAKLTLRALGSSQLAFANENEGEFATWDEMTKQDYIQLGYNRTNMIDNYSIAVFNISKSLRDEKNNIIKPSTFTIIAIPRSMRHHLRTFAIGDDQTPRVWVGKSDDMDYENISLLNLKMWEPLR